MEDILQMSSKERHRKSVFERVEAKEMTLLEASEVLGLSYRQCKRIRKRFAAEGDAGLVHRSRGRPSNRKKAQTLRRKALERYRSRYKPHGFGPTAAAEKLASEGIEVDHETLRRWLLEEGDWTRQRRRGQHRQRRERKKHFGELVQMDGSHHRWFGKDRDACCLMHLIDDATGERLALLANEETTEAAMALLWRWIERYGIPKALYCDRKSVYITEREPTLEEQLAGEEPMTSFGKACAKLGIKIIAARSPQAKGRVERAHAVYQDRFCKELALRRITTIETANKLLEDGFTRGLNEKFAQEAVEAADYHRKLPKGTDLAHVFCFEEHRQVQNDWTIRWQNQHFQILKDNKPLPKPKEKVLVRRLLDGSLHLIYREKPLAFRPIALAELKKRKAKASAKPKMAPARAKDGTKKRKPAAEHPWNKYPAVSSPKTMR